MANKPHSGSPEGDSANKMWGGRFETKPAEIMEEINASLSFDRRFYAEDIRASQGHANMLCAVGILTDAEAEAIVSGLDAVPPRSQRAASSSAANMRTSIWRWRRV